MITIQLQDQVLQQLTEEELDKINELTALELDLRLELHSIKYKVNNALKDLEKSGVIIDWGSREWMKGKSFQELKNIYKITRKELNFLNEQLNRKYAVREIQDHQSGDYIPF